MQTNTQLSMLVFGISGLFYLAVLIGGFFTAMTRWKKHPKVSLLVFVALGMMLAIMVTDIVFPPMAMYLASRSETGPDGMNWLFAARGLVSGLGRAAALAILLVAVFGWRGGAGAQEDEASTDNPDYPSYSNVNLSE